MSRILYMNASPNTDGSTVRNVSQFGAVRDNNQMKDMLNIIKNYDII